MIIKKISTEWTSENTTLLLGEIGYETDTYRFKIGNGVSPWIELRYATTVQETASTLASENLVIAQGIIVIESDTINKFKIGDGFNFWNNLPYEEIVTAARFNNLQSRINLILGNGTGDRGYGQGQGYGTAPSSFQVNNTDTIEASDINAIYADMVRARIHQIGTEPVEIKELVANLNAIARDTSFFIDTTNGQPEVSTDTQGTKKGLTDFELLMNTVDTERALAHPSQMTLETKLSSVRTALWNGIVFHEFSVTFQNADHRRHFFNSGGQIRISSRNTNATGRKGQDWDQVLLNAGIVSFNYDNTTTSGSGTGSNIGNYDLTSNYQIIYQKIGQGPVDSSYVGNTYIIYAKANDNKTITFKVEYNDLVTTTLESPIDTNVNGRLENLIQEYRASSSAVDVASPSFATVTALDTFGEPEPVYQLTTTKSTVKEGESFVIVLNTYNVPNGSSVPYVIGGTVTASDLGLSSLTGNFVINNNAASIIFTPILDSLENETTEQFILTLNNNADSITVNIENELLPTYNLTTNKTTVEEGDSFTITLNTTKVPDGTLVPYTITGVSTGDISLTSLSGNFVVNNNTASLNITTINDNLLEGNETFRLELDNQEDSVTVEIQDAQQITFALTSNKSTVKEGESFVITLNTTFIQNGTQVPYIITGVGAADLGLNSLTGSFTINNNTASITFNTILDDQTNEGDETFTLSLLNASASVSVVIEEVILPTSANRTCIAVIDESSVGGYDPSQSVFDADWADFRNKWPNRPFYLLQPNILNTGGVKYTNPSTVVLRVPAAYLADNNAFGPIQVNRDEGNTSRTSDWYSICNLDSLPDGSKIAVFIDTSGSMKESTVRASLELFRQKLAARNMQVIEVFNNRERWIEPFDTILD